MMMLFSTGLGWSVLGSSAGDMIATGLVYKLWIIEPEIGLLLGWFAGFVVTLSCRKEQERRRVGGASPVAALMPKSVPR